MPLPLSGPLSMEQIRAEFGGSYPISLSQYYRGGGLVPNTAQNAAVPTSGQISISNFYGAGKAIGVLYNIPGAQTNITALRQQAGTIYACTNTNSGFNAISISTTGGMTWNSYNASRPVLDLFIVSSTLIFTDPTSSVADTFSIHSTTSPTSGSTTVFTASAAASGGRGSMSVGQGNGGYWATTPSFTIGGNSGVFYSTNGTFWTYQSTIGAMFGISGVRGGLNYYSSGLYRTIGTGTSNLGPGQAVGYNNSLVTAPSGWLSPTVSGIGPAWDVAYDGSSRYVVVGDNGSGGGIARSGTNLGSTTVSTFNETPTRIQCVCWTGTKFVCGTNSGQVFTSPTGTTWTRVNTIPVGSLTIALAASTYLLMATGTQVLRIEYSDI